MVVSNVGSGGGESVDVLLCTEYGYGTAYGARILALQVGGSRSRSLGSYT